MGACNGSGDWGSDRLHTNGLRELARLCTGTRIGFAGVTLQVLPEGLLLFNEGGHDGLATCKAPRRASILNDEQLARLWARRGSAQGSETDFRMAVWNDRPRKGS